MSDRDKTIANVRVGKADVDISKPSHVSGVSTGDAKGNTRKARGMHQEGERLVAEPSRSTGVAPRTCKPILPEMPILTPP